MRQKAIQHLIASVPQADKAQPDSLVSTQDTSAAQSGGRCAQSGLPSEISS
jgi:hypothetical protein